MSFKWLLMKLHIVIGMPKDEKHSVKSPECCLPDIRKLQQSKIIVKIMVCITLAWIALEKVFEVFPVELSLYLHQSTLWVL